MKLQHKQLCRPHLQSETWVSRSARCIQTHKKHILYSCFNAFEEKLTTFYVEVKSVLMVKAVINPSVCDSTDPESWAYVCQGALCKSDNLFSLNSRAPPSYRECENKKNSTLKIAFSSSLTPMTSLVSEKNRFCRRIQLRSFGKPHLPSTLIGHLQKMWLILS